MYYIKATKAKPEQPEYLPMKPEEPSYFKKKKKKKREC